jgi:hypothetical protein
MIPAKKLITEEKEEQQIPREFQKRSTRAEHVVKLLIMMLLTYVIIFM